MFDLEHSTIERGQYTLCSETSRAFLLGAEICRTIYKWYSFTTVKNVFISCLRDWSPTVNTLSIDRGFEASGSKTSLLWGLRLSGSSTSRKPLPLLKNGNVVILSLREFGPYWTYTFYFEEILNTGNIDCERGGCNFFRTTYYL